MTTLRNGRLVGLKFVRQAPIGPYCVDFLNRRHKIVIEVDGGTHATDAEMVRDAARSSYLHDLGYRVLRAHNIEI